MEGTGGCACGQVRFRVRGDPMRVAVCHCKNCQRRTGSAFSVGGIFPRAAVEVVSGSMKVFERNSASGRSVKIRFCPNCGTSVMWDLEAVPDGIGIAGGTFDDTSWLDPKLHVWTREAQNWVTIPEDAEVLAESNLGASTLS